MIDKDRIRKNFSRYAVYYDKYCTAQMHSAVRLIEKVNSGKIRNILDIGCGTGNYTRLLREKFPHAAIKAFDISEKMVEIAKEKLQDKTTEFIVADAETKEFGENYDLISSNVSFQWFVDLESFFVRYKNLLRKNGTILFSIFGPHTYFELNMSLRELSGKNISIDSCRFIGKNKLNEILKKYFKKVFLEEEIFQENHESLLQLLKKIKYTGTTGNGIAYDGFWTFKRVEDLEKIYKKKFSNLTATYQIFYCYGIK